MLESEIVYLKPLARDFQTRHQNIHIELVGFQTTDAIKEAYTTDLSKNRPSHDLVYMDIIWLPKFADAEWLRELDKQFTEEELKQFLDEEINGGRYGQGQHKPLYRIPFRSDVGVLFYNKEFLNKYNPPENEPPKTFAELEKISKSFKGQNSEYWGYLWQSGKYEALITTFLEVLKAHKDSWFEFDDKSKQYKVELDEQKALNAIKLLRETINKKISPSYNDFYKEETYIEKFQKGEAAFLRGWPDVWHKIHEDNPEGKSEIEERFGLTQLVGLNGSGRGCFGGWGFGIPQKAQHPEAALRAIKFFTSEEVQRKFVLDTSYLPSRTKLFSDSEIQKKYPHFREMLETVKNAVHRPQTPLYDRASEILQCHLSAALSSDLEEEKIKAIIRSAKTKTHALLNEQKSPSICPDI